MGEGVGEESRFRGVGVAARKLEKAALSSKYGSLYRVTKQT